MLANVRSPGGKRVLPIDLRTTISILGGMRLAGWILIAVVGGCGATTTTAPITAARQPKPPVAASADMDPLVAARVDGVSILTRDVDRRLDAMAKARIEETVDPKARASLRAKERRRVLADMIDRQLLLAAAMARGIQPSDDEIDAALAEIRTQNNMTDAQLAEVIAKEGFGTIADYRRELGEQIQVLRYLAREAPSPEPRDAAAQRITAHLRARAKITIELPEVPSLAPVAGSGLGASRLLTAADLEAVLGHGLPKFETGPLQSDTPTAEYDSWHFQAIGQPETSDLAFRVWRLPAKELQQRWDELHSQLPDVHDETGLADASFRASGPDVFGRAFIDRKASIVVLLVCGSGLCTSQDQALAFAKLLHERQGRLNHR